MAATTFYELYGAFWRDGGRREFSPVAEWHAEPIGLVTWGDIFPNAKFGFNGRNLLIGTNPVCE